MSDDMGEYAELAFNEGIEQYYDEMLKPSNHMFSKVVGSTFVEGGQERLASLNSNEELKLIEEPENPFDSNAIAVYHKDKRIGYLPKNTAVSVKELMEENDLVCKVSEVTGGNGNHYGCNLSISW